MHIYEFYLSVISTDENKISIIISISMHKNGQ